MTKLESLFSVSAFFLIPFLGNNHLSLFYISIDQFWIETSFIIMLVAVVFLQYTRDRDTHMSLRVFLIFFVPFILVNIISLVYTWNLFSTIWEINVLIWAGSAVCVYAHSANRDRLLKAILAGAFLSSICSIVQFTVVFPNLFEIFQGGRYGQIVRGQAIPGSSFAYHNILGGYLAFVLPVAMYRCIVKKQPLYILVSSIIIVGIILTTSRIATAIVVLEMFFCIALALKERSVKGLFSIFGVFILTGICLFSLFFAGQKGVQTGVRNELEKKVTSIQTQITTMNTRTEIWENGINAFLAKPSIGHGAGTFEYAYRKYFDGGVYTRYSHSVILKVLVELGLLGMLCVVWYLTGVLYGIKKSVRDYREIFLCISLCAAILFAILDFAFDIPAFVITFFIFSFVILPGSVQGTARAGLKHLFSCIVIILLISSLFLTVKANLSKKSIDNGAVYLESGFVKNAYYAYIDAIQEMPLDNEGRIKAIGILNNVYPHEKDMEKKGAFQRMLLGHLAKVGQYRDKDSELYFVTGTAYSLMGDTKKAEEYLLKAHSYYPSSAYYIYEITNFYISVGDLQKAFFWTHKIDPFLVQYRASRNPNGLYVYKIRDREAEIQYRLGHKEKAFFIANTNLKDAENETFLITSIKAREYIRKDLLVNDLKKRALTFQSLQDKH